MSGGCTNFGSFVDRQIWGLTACLAIATFAYAALSTMILNLPADIYASKSVASVSGVSGTGAGAGTILATYLTGMVADRYSFRPVLIVRGAATSLGRYNRDLSQEEAIA